MSDIFIPGVSDTYKTEKIIEEIMKAERVPVVRMENEVQTYRNQKTAWLGLNRHFTTVRDNARGLYGFQSPFLDRVAESSDPGQFSATAVRSAQETRTQVRVRQLAAADRFMSQSLDREFRADAGTYRFRVGDREVSIRFKGGTLRELAEAINRGAKDLLKASVVNDTPQSQVLVVESLRTGSRNPLTFHDDALTFGERAGLLERTRTGSREIHLEPGSVQAADRRNFSVQEGTLSLQPGARLSIPLSPPLSIEGPRVLVMEVRTIGIPEDTAATPSPPSGPDIPGAGDILFEGIRVENEPSRVILPVWKPPEKPPRVDDRQVLFLDRGGSLQALPPLPDSGSFQKLRFEEQGSGITALTMHNRNTHRTIEIRAVRVEDTSARGDFRPVRPLSTASDSIVEVDGVEVTRESNAIEDLIPGVTLTLHSTGERAAQLEVGRDKEGIKGALISLIGSYNQTITQIDILTRRDESVIEDALFLTEEQKKQARADLGLFMGDLSLMQVKSALQRIMMNAYPTEGEQKLSLLAQIGISTNAGGPGGPIVKTRLRGYLEINEQTLDGALAAHPEWVRQLFGFDGDGDLVVDSGVAYTLERYLRAYVDTGGVIPTRMASLDGMISRKSRDIQAYNSRLENTEAELRRKYGKMEGALDQLRQSSQYLENWTKSNQGQ